MSFLPVARVAAFSVVAIGILGLLGTAYAADRTRILGLFDLDGEWNVPAIFSAALFFVAAAVLVHVRHVFSRSWVTVLFAALLVYISIDELAQVHERVERWVGVDWQRLYAPLLLLIGLTWCLLMADLWKDRRASLLFLGSGIAWVASQTLEYFEWDGDVGVPRYTEMMLVEEMLEMVGTALLILAFLYAGDAARRARDPFCRSHEP